MATETKPTLAPFTGFCWNDSENLRSWDFVIYYAVTRYTEQGRGCFDVDLLDIVCTGGILWFGKQGASFRFDDADHWKLVMDEFETALMKHRHLVQAVEAACIADYERGCESDREDGR